MKNFKKKLSIFALSTALIFTASPSYIAEASEVLPDEIQLYSPKAFMDFKPEKPEYNEIRFLIRRFILQPELKGEGRFFRPNDIVTKEEFITLLGKALKLDATPRDTAFKDVKKTNKNSGLIQSAYEADIITRPTDGKFQGNMGLNNGQIADLINRAFALKNTATINFKDVKKGTSLYNNVSKLVAAGIVTSEEKTFGPDTKTSRIQIAVFLARALGFESEKPTGEEVKLHVLDADEQSYVLETNKGRFILFNPGNDYAQLKANLKKQKITSLSAVYITNPSTMGALNELVKDKEFRKYLDGEEIKGTKGRAFEIPTVIADKVVDLQGNPDMSYFEYRPGYFAVDNIGIYSLHSTAKGELSVIIGDSGFASIALLTNITNQEFKTLLANSKDAMALVQTVIVDDKTVENNLSKDYLFYNEVNKTGFTRKVYFESDTPANYKIKASKYADVRTLKDGDVIYP